MTPTRQRRASRHDTLSRVTSKGTERKTVRVPPDLWDEFGRATADHKDGRSGVLRDFMRWFLRKSNAELPTPDNREGHMPEEATKPERAPVVAGIVTSDRGVLIGRRHDGKPLWTFIAGEIEPGESPADAAIREVKEETGLLVRAADREIGRRVHPKTGRTMIYLACYPTGKLDVFVGDEDELAEVRWAGLEEAQELLPGLFDPVLKHLQRELSATD